MGKHAWGMNTWGNAVQVAFWMMGCLYLDRVLPIFYGVHTLAMRRSFIIFAGAMSLKREGEYKDGDARTMCTTYGPTLRSKEPRPLQEVLPCLRPGGSTRQPCILPQLVFISAFRRPLDPQWHLIIAHCHTAVSYRDGFNISRCLRRAECTEKEQRTSIRPQRTHRVPDGPFCLSAVAVGLAASYPASYSGCMFSLRCASCAHHLPVDCAWLGREQRHLSASDSR